MYPPISPHDHGMLTVGQGHQVYWECSGSPDGIPVLYLHGGAGSALQPGYRRHFDPTLYRIIGLQTRGTGRSLPRLLSPEHRLADNTTPHLVDDIDALRKHLGVDRWLVSAMSWGTRLALHYSVEHREDVLGLVLLATGTTSAKEVHWITEGVADLYPEAWQQLADVVSELTPWEPGQGRLIDAVATLMAEGTHAERTEMAVAWMAWEDSHVQIGTPVEELRPVTMCERPIADQIAFTTIVTHFWKHHSAADPAWLPKGPLMGQLGALKGLPLCMIHGRRDVSSPVSAPWAIKRELPEAQLHVVEHEGHGGPHMEELWVRATDSFARSGDFRGVVDGW